METTPERNAVQPSRPGNKDTKGDVAASNSSQDVKSSTNLEARLHRRLRGISLSKHQPALSASKHVRIQEEVQKPVSSASSIYRGSFNYTPRRSMASLGESLKSQPLNSRGAFDAAQLEGLLTDLHMDLETYDMEELRDGFFDASFAKPPKSSPDDLVRDAEETLPRLLRMEHPLSVSNFLPDQWAGVKEVVKLVFTTRAGIKLLKSFLSFFIAYTICLIPTSSKWLGKYNYIIAISTIINHAGRPVGAQIDGFVATVSGTVVGLGWGAFALWLSNSTSVARRGYGGVLVTFLILFMAPLSALRSYYIRLYQFVLCAGMSIIYTCLADTSDDVRWRKFFDYGIPWVLGQALCLIICCTVWPDAGARPLAVALHDSLNTMQQSLSLPQEDPIRIHRLLAMAFVNLSQAQRDFSIDFSLSRFDPDDVRDLRNLMQAVIRSLLSLKMEAHVFNDHEELKLKDASRYHTAAPNMDNSRVSVPDIQIDTVLDIDKPRKVDLRERTRRQEQAAQLVVDKLADPTLDCLLWIETALQRCDAVLMDMSGYRRYLGPPKETSSDILQVLTKMRKNMIKYDAEEDALLRHPGLPQVYSDHPDVVQMLLFSRPVRQAATATENLLIKVMAMQQKKPGWRPYLPSYPFKKGLQRTNAQVRHDRGGVTAGYYFRSQSELADSLGALSTTYKPLPRSIEADSEPMPLKRRATFAQLNQDGHLPNDYNPKEYEKRRIRYRLWKILHRLQGFETRFGLKVAIVTSLLAIPAWLDSSRGWWNENEIWWAIVIVWVMMHPR